MIKGDSEKIERDHFDIFKTYTKFYFLSEGGPKLLSSLFIVTFYFILATLSYEIIHSTINVQSSQISTKICRSRNFMPFR